MSGYLFEPDELRAAHDEWERLLVEIRQDMEEGLAMIDIMAPGDEPASETMAVSGHDSGEAFKKHSQSMQDYVQRFVHNLAATGAGYLQEEESAGRRFSYEEPR